MDRIFSKGTLRDYWRKNPETEQYLKTWFETVAEANWKIPRDVKSSFASASILKDGRVVFNIKGNSFRLVARINYEIEHDWSGTH